MVASGRKVLKRGRLRWCLNAYRSKLRLVEDDRQRDLTKGRAHQGVGLGGSGTPIPDHQVPARLPKSSLRKGCFKGLAKNAEQRQEWFALANLWMARSPFLAAGGGRPWSAVFSNKCKNRTGTARIWSARRLRSRRRACVRVNWAGQLFATYLFRHFLK